MTTMLKLPGLRDHLPMLPAKVGSAAGPRLLEKTDRSVDGPMELKRRRIWELSSSFHCSIIGTCLTTGELREILVKIGLPGVRKQSDHELHGRAVLLANRRDNASKLLQKALDRRHRSVIAQFGKARSSEQLRVTGQFRDASSRKHGLLPVWWKGLRRCTEASAWLDRRSRAMPRLYDTFL